MKVREPLRALQGESAARPRGEGGPEARSAARTLRRGPTPSGSGLWRGGEAPPNTPPQDPDPSPGEDVQRGVGGAGGAVREPPHLGRCCPPRRGRHTHTHAHTHPTALHPRPLFREPHAGPGGRAPGAAVPSHPGPGAGGAGAGGSPVSTPRPGAGRGLEGGGGGEGHRAQLGPGSEGNLSDGRCWLRCEWKPARWRLMTGCRRLCHYERSVVVRR